MGVSFIWLLPSTRGPALPMRARRLGRRPGQLFGLSVGKRGATTLAIQRSLSGAWTMGQSVYRALTADSTATRNIQGARGRAEAALRPDLSDAAPTGPAYFAPETRAVVNEVGPHLRGLLSSIVQKALERSARRG